jgi:hypothetical protein
VSFLGIILPKSTQIIIIIIVHPSYKKKKIIIVHPLLWRSVTDVL